MKMEKKKRRSSAVQRSSWLQLKPKKKIDRESEISRNYVTAQARTWMGHEEEKSEAE
jgi:hypothetical protein